MEVRICLMSSSNVEDSHAYTASRMKYRTFKTHDSYQNGTLQYMFEQYLYFCINGFFCINSFFVDNVQLISYIEKERDFTKLKKRFVV